MEGAYRLYEAILSGDAVRAREITEHAIAMGAEPMHLVDDYMSPAMEEAGRQFEAGKCFVPHLMLSARAMKISLGILRPLMRQHLLHPAGSVVLGTVRGDLHDIGKNIVASVLEGGGFEVIDLGVEVVPEQFVAAVRARHPQLIGLSAMLTTTMMEMKSTLAALTAAGVRNQVKVMVGGAPVTQEFAEEIGADDFGRSAVDALTIARRVAAGAAARAAA